MKEQHEAKFSEAVKFHEEGQLESARKILLEIAEQDPNSVPILAVLGHVCWDMRAWDEAISAFRRGAELAPKLEAVSLGLFHCLWKVGRRVEALEEIKRFLSISDSEDYREIVKEINEKW